MQEDLKKIKKKYGEDMMHLCRELFPTILETEGLLYSILSKKFAPSKHLYDDITYSFMEEEFKSLIFSEIDVEKKEVSVEKTPAELLKEAGYILYECNTEEDIQKFKKYYAENEELCTFRGGRLERCHVFFAVKENVDEIKREDFDEPNRQDEYGTSVISIQFTRGLSNTLSIKNRYNHAVNNPDATFNNNLDNIIEGLTDSFSKYYGYNINYGTSAFELPNYVMTSDGRYYYYNYELDNIYYCPGNVIIDEFQINADYMNERYIMFDYFILDLKEKKITRYKEEETVESMDSFTDEFTSFDKAEVLNIENGERKITIKNKDKEDIIIIIDDRNRIVEYINNNMVECNPSLLINCKSIRKFEARNLKMLPAFTLKNAVHLKELITPNVEEVDNWVLENNKRLEKLDLPNVIKIGHRFLTSNRKLEKLDLPNVRSIGMDFLASTNEVTEADFPNLEIVGDRFMMNSKVNKFSAPKLSKVGNDFLYGNKQIKEVILESLKDIGNNFISLNGWIDKVFLPNVEKIGNAFLEFNADLEELELPSVKTIGDYFLSFNQKLKKFSVPNLEKIGTGYLVCNEEFDPTDIEKVSSGGKSI